MGGPRDPCSRQNRRKPKDFRGVLSSKRLCDRYSSRRGPIVRTKSRGPPRVSYRGDGCLLALFEPVKLAVLQLLQHSEQKPNDFRRGPAFSTLACVHKVRASVEVKTKSGSPPPVRGTVQTGFLTHLMHEHNCPAAFPQQQATVTKSQFSTILAQERLRNG